MFGWKVSKEMREPIVTGLFVGISCTYCYKVIKGSGWELIPKNRVIVMRNPTMPSKG